MDFLRRDPTQGLRCDRAQSCPKPIWNTRIYSSGWSSTFQPHQSMSEVLRPLKKPIRAILMINDSPSLCRNESTIVMANAHDSRRRYSKRNSCIIVPRFSQVIIIKGTHCLRSLGNRWASLHSGIHSVSLFTHAHDSSPSFTSDLSAVFNELTLSPAMGRYQYQCSGGSLQSRRTNSRMALLQ